MDDTPRQAATAPDSDFTLSIEQALELYAQAGLDRTPRSIQRYCAKGHLQARLIETEFGEKYLINPESVSRHIAYIREVTPVATSRDLSRPVATSRDTEIQHQTTETSGTTGSDTPRQAATPPDDRYTTQLEKENEFLRGQVSAKDKTIEALLERDKETNVLIAGMQKIFATLQLPARDARDRVPERGVTRGGAPHSPAWAGSVSWRLPEG